jgi:hypothetical protein
MIASVWLTLRFVLPAPRLPDAEAVAAWPEGNDLLDLDPLTVSDRGILLRCSALERYGIRRSQGSGSRARGPRWPKRTTDAALMSVETRIRMRAAPKLPPGAPSPWTLNRCGYAILGLTLMSWRWNWAEAGALPARAGLDPRSAYGGRIRRPAPRRAAGTRPRTHCAGRVLLPDLPVLANKQAELN